MDRAVGRTGRQLGDMAKLPVREGGRRHANIDDPAKVLASGGEPLAGAAGDIVGGQRPSYDDGHEAVELRDADMDRHVSPPLD
jgi:hypothetical protein